MSESNSRIPSGDGRAPPKDLVEPLELAEPESGTDVVDPIVETEASMVEPAPESALPDCATAEEPPLVLGVRRHHAAFSGRHLLVR